MSPSRKEIEPQEEANMLAIPRKQRAMVRKGIKNGLVSHIDASGVDRFLRCMPTTCTAMARRPCPRNTFKALLQVFGADCEVLTVTDAGRAPAQQRDELLLSR